MIMFDNDDDVKTTSLASQILWACQPFSKGSSPPDLNRTQLG